MLYGLQVCYRNENRSKILSLIKIIGERSRVVKRDDNLHPEGEFHKRPDQVWAPGDRANVIRRDDNLQPEGDFSKRPDATWAPGSFSEL